MYCSLWRSLHFSSSSSLSLQDRTLRLNELNSLRKQIEQEFQRKMKLEEDIMETMRNKLTMDKASEYARKMAGKIRTRIAEAVSNWSVNLM